MSPARATLKRASQARLVPSGWLVVALRVQSPRKRKPARRVAAALRVQKISANFLMTTIIVSLTLPETPLCRTKMLDQKDAAALLLLFRKENMRNIHTVGVSPRLPVAQPGRTTMPVQKDAAVLPLSKRQKTRDMRTARRTLTLTTTTLRNRVAFLTYPRCLRRGFNGVGPRWNPRLTGKETNAVQRSHK